MKIARTAVWPKLAVYGFPLAQAERLRAPLGVDAGVSQTKSRALAARAGDAPHRPAELLAPELEGGLDQAEEGVHVRDLHGRLLAHVKQNQRRIANPLARCALYLRLSANGQTTSCEA